MDNIDEMGVGRELDALVAEKVMGLRRVEDGNVYFWPSPEMVEQIRKEYPDVLAIDYFPALFYSTDIAAAMGALRHFRTLYRITGDSQSVVVELTMRDGKRTFDVFGYGNGFDELPLAISRALLKAVTDG